MLTFTPALNTLLSRINPEYMITQEEVQQTCSYLQDRTTMIPEVGIVLGTGMNSLVQSIEVKQKFDYQEIPHFPVSTVEFHKGQLIFGFINGISVVVMQGRFHYYEGYSLQQVTFPVRVMKALGIKYLLLSNAAGGMNPDYKKGDLVLVEDHINLLPDNPLRGLDATFGNRFVDMSESYAPNLIQALKQIGLQQNILLKKGTYVAVMGPNLETRAEYRWLRSMGADMVGMSTVPEVIVANQVGVPCAAISVITDECDPDNLKPISIQEIIEVAGKADQELSRIFVELIASLRERKDQATSGLS